MMLALVSYQETPSPQAMHLKTDECPNGQTDMVTLRDLQPELSAFNTRALFQAAMINLNLPSIDT